jgi:hypothetical protein
VSLSTAPIGFASTPALANPDFLVEMDAIENSVVPA